MPEVRYPINIMMQKIIDAINIAEKILNLDKTIKQRYFIIPLSLFIYDEALQPMSLESLTANLSKAKKRKLQN
jgi:hypothetical protein